VNACVKRTHRGASGVAVPEFRPAYILAADMIGAQRIDGNEVHVEESFVEKILTGRRADV